MARGLSEERIQMGEAAWAEHVRVMNNEKALKYRRGLHVVSWHRRTKIKLIAYKGGKCEQCGYCKNCPSAFTFHHKNPNEKDFTIARKTWSFERLKREVDKCSLLCSNCHAETHEKEYDEIRKTEERNFADRPSNKIVKCGICGTEFKPRRRTQKFCSSNCNIKSNTKVEKRPTRDELEILIETVHCWEELGRRFGVGGNAVKKWARKYGIPLPVYRSPIIARPCCHCGLLFKAKQTGQKFCSITCHGLASRKVVRPSMEELIEMRKTQTLEQIASRYGVKHCTVRAWIERKCLVSTPAPSPVPIPANPVAPSPTCPCSQASPD